MKLSDFDFEISLAAWLTSCIATIFFPIAAVLVLATTFNLWHQRNVLYRAGEEFERRVKRTLEAEQQAFDERLKAIEKSTRDIKDAHNNITAAMGGRHGLVVR